MKQNKPFELNLLNAFIYLSIYLFGGTQDSTHVEVKEQLVGDSSLYRVNARDQTPVPRFGSK